MIPPTSPREVEARKKAIEQTGDKLVTAEIVHKAAAQFKPEKKGKKSKKTGTTLNLEPAVKILAQLEVAAGKSKVVLGKLKALKKCLLRLVK